MEISKRFQRVALIAALAATPAAADYLGTLKLPNAQSAAPLGFYTLSETPPQRAAMLTGSGENAFRLKLGYKYSRYLAVESEYVDFGTSTSNVFAVPPNLASAFRSTGFGVDTIATVPIWRQFSFYGRLGAYSGSRNIFSPAFSLLGDTSRARVRYGLGVRYDFTKSLGVRAELERYSPLGTPLTGDPEADLFSVGLSWRF
jgi:hypothetical protein